MVLFASYSGAFGGGERLLLDFAAGLDHASVLVCPEGRLADEARAAGMTVFISRARSLRLRGRARERALAAARLADHGREVRELVRNLAPQLLIAWGMRSAIACTLGPGLPCPLVFQHNDLLPSAGVARVVRAAARRADLTIALSDAIARDLDPAGALRDRLQVVHPGIDVQRFNGHARPANPPEVLVLGALTAWKRPELAVDACTIVRRRHPELRLRLVGAPIEDDRVFLKLRDRTASLDWVELPGASVEPASDLSRAYCLLHCADREPFGLAVLEALAAGRPAVAPGAAGPAEIVDHSCGRLYAPGDAVAAAAALDELLSDPQRAAGMGAAGRERARRQFGLDDARTRYRRVVQGVLAASARYSARRAGTGEASAELALLTVTHNSANELRTLLTAVARHLPGVRVLVVDCASEDESVAVAGAEEFAEVIALEQNVGFGRACNRGLRELRTTVTALINPDVELVDDSLLALAAEAARRDRLERLLAPLVLNPDGSRQDTVHPRPASGPDLARALVPPRAVPERFGGVWLAPWRSASPRRVGWIVGCALVAKTDTLRALGPFDERLFLYGEDLELGLRASEHGVESWFWPSAHVIHHRARSTARAFGGEPFGMLAQTRHDVLARRLGERRASVDDAAQALTFGSRRALKRLLRRDAERERSQLRAVQQVRR